ncbi:hypothetical protein E2C01_064702 [Portunus trituberculatus]|uniref:Uncharacterized protein n=1 Tax=Portunus trituberculatus TaxID=210409 RepID=A0A5B7HJV1_PORTR|nr:hypothetical protein [Portunus trituberculatus]
MNETQPETKERVGVRTVILWRARPAGRQDPDHDEERRGGRWEVHGSCSSDGSVLGLLLV